MMALYLKITVMTCMKYVQSFMLLSQSAQLTHIFEYAAILNIYSTWKMTILKSSHIYDWLWENLPVMHKDNFLKNLIE